MKRNSPFFKRIIVYFLMVLLAVIRIISYENTILSDQKAVSEDTILTIECKVKKNPSLNGDTITFIANDLTGCDFKSSAYVKVMNAQAMQLNVGDKLRLKATASVPKGSLNKVGYNFKNQLKSRGASVVLTCDYKDVVLIKKSAFSALYEFRNKISREISKTLTADNANLVKALALGDKSQMTDVAKDNFRKAGVYHIVAVSGLHLGLLLIFLYAAYSGIKIKSRNKKFISLVVTFVGSMFLLIFTGYGISVYRAAFMALFLSVSAVSSREYSPLLSLFYIFLAVIYCAPFYISDPSFQLSFGATFGILASAPFLKKLTIKNRALKCIAESVIITQSASLATLPFVIYHFGSYSLIGIVSNLVILLIVPLLLLCSYVFVILCAFVPFIAHVVGKYFLNPIAGSVNYLADCFASLPFSSIGLNFYSLIPVFVTIIAVLVVIKIKRKTFYYAFAALFIIANICFISYNSFVENVYVTFLNVGQGDCTLIHSTDGSSFMVDCGSDTEYSIAQNEIKPYLNYKTIHKLDGVFLTHLHNDHTSGIEYLIKTNTIKKLFIPDTDPNKSEIYNTNRIISTAVKYGVPVYFVSAGDVITFGDNHKFKIVHPHKAIKAKQNNSSLVIDYTYLGKHILFMGDNEEEGQMSFIGNLEDCDIMKVAHHGGKSLFSSKIYDITTPEISVISCGKNNKYGHPAKETLDAFKSSTILRTDTMGAIEVKIDKEKISWKLR